MRLSTFLPVLVLVSLLVTLAPAAERKAIRLFAEAEDFRVEKGEWKVVPWGENYYAATFAVTFLSRKACLGAPAQCGEAVAMQRVEIPYASDYQVAARFEQPYNFAVEFTIEIQQKGKAVYRETFGRLADPKIWAFNRHERVPMHRYSWGGTDNIVWQMKGSAKLAAGPATIRLIAGPQLDGNKPRTMAAKRHVDVICLTNDTAGLEVQRKKARYLELDGWLVLDGDLFVRFTNPRDGLGPCIPIVAPHLQGQHSPYWVHVRDWPTTRVLKSGRLTSPTSYRVIRATGAVVSPQALAPELDPARFKTIPDAEYLQPGDASGWVPLGPVCDALCDCVWFPRAQYKGRKDKELDLIVEFGIPSFSGAVEPIRKVRVKGVPGTISPVSFLVPGDVLRQRWHTKAERPLIRTQLEWLQWLKAEVARFPKRGSVPKRLPVHGLMSFSGATRQDNAIGRLATEIALALGDNTITSLRGPWAERLGVPKRRTGLVAHWRPAKLDNLKKRADAAEKKGHLDQIRIVSYGDEIHIPPAKPDDAKFAAWLEQRGVEWSGGAKVTTKREDPLYYYSRLWAIEAGIEHYAEATRWLEGRMGKGVLTGANYSPHANYLVTDLQWVRPFKMRGMTMPWSEDYVWGIPEVSVQIVGYLTSAFRCGAKYHKLPIMMYVMPHTPGNTPRDFRLSFYTAVAHGAKLINYFCAVPLCVGYTENHILTDDLAMWKAVHDVTHEAGIFEDYVLDGTVRPAQVGLLLSSVDEILTGDTNFKGAIHNAERKAIYYALRHSQIPVDFVTEDDVIDGRAKSYKLIYVTQQYLHSKAVRALTDWAKAGGTVVALCGGGFRNEFAKPNPGAEALYGAKSGGIEKDPAFAQILAKQDLPPAKPLATAKWATLSGVEVIAWKQRLQRADGKALGRFPDGSPAVIEKRHGKGRAILFGFLPALAWLKSGLPLRPPDRGATNADYNHFLPTEMDEALRRRLVDDFLPDGFVRPVECSERLVEATCIDTPKPPCLAVPLMNYTGEPIAKLTVTVQGLAKTKSVRSIEQGTLKPTFEGGAMTVTLPLDVTDMLLINR